MPAPPGAPGAPGAPAAPAFALDKLNTLVKDAYPDLVATIVTFAVSADIAVTLITLFPTPLVDIVHPDAVEVKVQEAVETTNPSYTTASVETPEKELTVPELSATTVLFSSVKYIKGVVVPLVPLYTLNRLTKSL